MYCCNLETVAKYAIRILLQSLIWQQANYRIARKFITNEIYYLTATFCLKSLNIRVAPLKNKRAEKLQQEELLSSW